MARSLLGTLFLAILTAQCGPSAVRESSNAATSWSVDHARILFTARRGLARELYVLDRATGDTTRVTNAGGEDSGANGGRISPDGLRVAYQLRQGKDYEIHVMHLPGGASVNVSRHPEYDVLPVWSPDGRMLAFMSTRGFELGGIGPSPVMSTSARWTVRSCGR